MIKQLPNKPQHYLGELENCHWIEGTKDDIIYGYVAIKQADETANIHMEIIKWSHNIMREALIDWENVKGLCKHLGIKTIFVPGQQEIDSTWTKFVKLFGFSDIEQILIAKQEI